MNFETLLTQLGTDRHAHAKLINTFSLMEYIGARKILKSQNENQMSETLLTHVAEEVRHALTLKRLALKMSEGKLETYGENDTLGAHAAQNYMQTVDVQGAKVLECENSWKNYLASTWLIEERALAVYPAYEKHLSSLGFSGFFTGILKDEEKHSQFIDTALKVDHKIAGPDQARLRALENQAFSDFCNAVSKSV